MMNDAMNFLFDITVVLLRALAAIFHTDYYTVNIWFYCIVGPVFFCLLMTILWTETVYGVVAHHGSMNAISNIALLAMLLLLVVIIGRAVVEAVPIWHSIAGDNKVELFKRCVDYLNGIRGNVSYVNINVWLFCLIGPLIFLLVIFLDITGLHQFHWHWLAIFGEPYAWRYWLNTIVLCFCVPCCYYALFVLKRYVLR